MRHLESEKNRAPLSIVITGGGTGGHLFPAISMAEAFRKKDPKTRILFISSGNEFEVKNLALAGFDLEKITVGGLKGKGPVNQIKTLMRIPLGTYQAARILKRFKPDLVVGVGGYSSGPVALAARLLGIDLALHEQNILPGITNRAVSVFARRVYVSFNETRLEGAGGFLPSINPEKVMVAGNPIRKQVLEPSGDEETSDSLFYVLILGGSQGAHKINVAIMEALPFFKEKKTLFFIHQTGALDAKEVETAYERQGAAHCVKPFFKDMGRLYRVADLIICRSGAGSVAEISATGNAAVFVPFPFAADDHQTLNAMTMKKKGAAEIVFEDDLTGRLIYERISAYRSNEKKRLEMAEKARAMGNPNAAETIVEDCYQWVRRC